MLRYFIQKVHQRRWSKPRMVICVPSGITGVEQRAVQEAAEYAGARKPAYIIEEPMAAAIGAGLPVQEPTGNMIVDIGGGTTEVAVISLGGIVASQSVRVGGDELDEAIVQFIKKEYSLAVGERTAEEVKIALGSAWPLEEELHAEIRGRDLVTGPAQDDRHHHRGDPRGHRGAGVGHRRRREGHPRQDAAGARRRHHGDRASCWPAAARCCTASGPPASRDRHADRDRAEPAPRRRHRLGPVAGGVRGPQGRAVLLHEPLTPRRLVALSRRTGGRSRLTSRSSSSTSVTLLTLDFRDAAVIQSARRVAGTVFSPLRAARRDRVVAVLQRVARHHRLRRHREGERGGSGGRSRRRRGAPSWKRTPSSQLAEMLDQQGLEWVGNIDTATARVLSSSPSELLRHHRHQQGQR